MLMGNQAYHGLSIFVVMKTGNFYYFHNWENWQFSIVLARFISNVKNQLISTYILNVKQSAAKKPVSMSYLILLHLFMFHSLKMQRRPAVLPNVYVKLQFVIEWPEGTATNHEQWTEITAQATWKNTQAVNQIVYECLFLGTNFSSILTTMKQPHDTIISKDENLNSYMRLKFYWPVYFYISPT